MTTPKQALRALLRTARTQVIVLIALSVLLTGTYVGQGILLARVFGVVIDGGTVGSALWPLLGVVAFQALRSGILVVREVAGARAAAAVKDALRRRLYRKLLDLGPGEVRRRRTGDLQSTVVDAVEAVDPYVSRFVPQAIAGVISALAVAAYLVVLDPLVGLIVVVCGTVVPIVPALSRRLTDRRMEPWMRSYRGLYAENLDAVQGMTTLKLFGAGDRRGRELHEKAAAFCEESIRLCALVVVYVGVVAAFVGAGTALSVGLGSLRTAEGQLSTASLLIILLLTREAFRPLRQLQDAYHAAAPAQRAVLTIAELLDTEPAVRDAAHPVPASALPRPPSIAFEHVTFGYPGRETPALTGVDLAVAPGERIGLVGPSGAGKSTLVSLLLRWFDPDEGRVLLGGVDVRRVGLADLRAQVALVSQDIYLFHGTVRENVLLADPLAGEDRLRDVLTAARAGFVHDLPRGLDTVIGERGMRLSGGERQRLAIARALLTDAPVLVLDEATSSLDAANEAELARTLDELSQGRTTLTIAHRLSTVRAADRIVVLEHGRVVESGAPDDLLAAGGAFSRLSRAGAVAR